MKYSSKIGIPWMITFAITLLCNLIGIASIIRTPSINNIFIFILIFLLTLYFILSLIYTSYFLDENELHIRSLFSAKKINYQLIKHYETCKDTSSAPALSANRIRIETEKESILISPKQKKDFLQQLEQKITENKA